MESEREREREKKESKKINEWQKRMCDMEWEQFMINRDDEVNVYIFSAHE